MNRLMIASALVLLTPGCASSVELGGRAAALTAARVKTDEIVVESERLHLRGGSDAWNFTVAVTAGLRKGGSASFACAQ